MKTLLGNWSIMTHARSVAPSQCGGFLCFGSVSSSPREGAGEATVALFVPAALRCAVHFSTASTSRAEEAATGDEVQHQHQHQPILKYRQYTDVPTDYRHWTQLTARETTIKR